MSRASRRKSILIGAVAAILSGCIAAPPGSSTSGTDASSTADSTMDAGSSTTDLGPVEGDTAPPPVDAGGEDAEVHVDFGVPLKPYRPLRTVNVGWNYDADNETGVNTDNILLRHHARAGLNFRITSGPASELILGGHELLWVGREFEIHFDGIDAIAFREAGVPLITTENGATNELRLASGTKVEPVDETSVQIPDPLHPIAQLVGLGQAEIYEPDGALYFRPTVPDSAQVAATNLLGNPIVYGFEFGSALTQGSVAADRRVVFTAEEFENFNGKGWDLLDGAAMWAIGETYDMHHECYLIHAPPADFETYALRTRMRLHGCEVTLINVGEIEPQKLSLGELVVVQANAATRAAGQALTPVEAPILVFWTDTEGIAAMGLASSQAASQIEADSWHVPRTPDERLRAGRNGSVKVTMGMSGFPGVPRTSVGFAEVFAGQSDSDLAHGWAVDVGEQLADGSSANRRSVAMARKTTTEPYTDEAYELVDGAIQWLLDH